MANRSKEDSDIDPVEDELEFVKAMKHAGFHVQVPWQMPLAVPGDEHFGFESPLGGVVYILDGVVTCHCLI